MTTYKSKISDTTAFADYQFRVKPTNQQGAGDWSMLSAPVQFNYNEVTNTNYVDVPNHPYGGTWRVHTFTSSAQLDVVASIQPWKVALVSGGGGGGSGWYEHRGANGGTGGGKEVEIAPELISPGNNLVTVGARGNAGCWNCCCGCGCCGGGGGGGGTSSFAGQSFTGGGGGHGGTPPDGADPNSWYPYPPPAGASRPGLTSSISGSSKSYRPGGGGGGQHADGGGGGCGGHGVRGEVIIAYKVG